MDLFRNHLQQEYLQRSGKNPAYSLRSFAAHLDINHATLSALISGKRKITKSTLLKLSKALHMSPSEVQIFLNEEAVSAQNSTNASYYLLQNDAFAMMSEWYYDAILEMTLIKNVKLSPAIIADALDITPLQARLALEMLERLELLEKNKNGKFEVRHQNSTNILDPDFTTTAQKKYQRSVIEKSLEALQNIDRKKRDHTSTTMAINTQDLPKVKELIKDFRYKLNNYLQRTSSAPDEVYQLQVSFFPLSKFKK